MAVPPLAVSGTNIKVLNAALALLGVNPVTSFLDDSIAARTGNALFADTLEAALADYPWRFARDRVSLTQLELPAPPPWSAVFQMPSNALSIIAVYEGDQKVLHDVFGGKIAVMSPGEASVFWAEITATVGPDGWAGHFRAAFIHVLAGVLAMPLTQDEQLTAYVSRKGETLMLKAKSRDAQGRSPSRVDTKGFIRARRGGR